MTALDYEAADSLLRDTFDLAEGDFLQNSPSVGDRRFADVLDTLFRSASQGYREALLGCLLARLLDRSINIRLPYANQGTNAFNARSLDERVVNPILHEKQIPCSRGPYLAMFRRSVRFDDAEPVGRRDKAAHRAFYDALSFLGSTVEQSALHTAFRNLLYRFVELRERATIPLHRIQRLSLEQYKRLLARLLATPSGGLLPVLLSVATFKTIKMFYDLDWEIAWQRINVADRASGAGGDITVSRNSDVLLEAEVTERRVDRARVVTTFTTKIAPLGIQDYLFLFGDSPPTEEARRQADQYFAQGHEVNFVHIAKWIEMSLVSMGQQGRAVFSRELLGLLEEAEVPQAIRAAWNVQIDALTSLG